MEKDAPPPASLAALLSSSLTLWQSEHVVVASADQTIAIHNLRGETVLIINRPPTPLRQIFRWSVTSSSGMSRNSTSVLGLLGTVRDLLEVPSDNLPLRLGVTGTAS